MTLENLFDSNEPSVSNLDKRFETPMMLTDEQRGKLDRAQSILGYRFNQEQLLLSAITLSLIHISEPTRPL